MDFGFDQTTSELQQRLLEFMDDCVYPAEARFADEVASADDPWRTPPVLEELKAEGRRRGLWNLFLPRTHEFGAGLTHMSTLNKKIYTESYSYTKPIPKTVKETRRSVE